MTDIFASYEQGLTVLVRWLNPDHPRYTEALTLQNRLLVNIHQTLRHGDTETRRADRAQILEQLNDLALIALGTSFNGLCVNQDVPSSSESADVRGLLEAMGYRIVDSRALVAFSDTLRDKRADRYQRYNMASMARYLPKTEEFARALVWCVWHDASSSLLWLSLKNNAVNSLTLFAEDIFSLLDQYTERAKRDKKWQVSHALNKVKRDLQEEPAKALSDWFDGSTKVTYTSFHASIEY